MGPQQQDQQTPNQIPSIEPLVQPDQPVQQAVPPVQSVEQIEPVQQIEPVEPLQPSLFPGSAAGSGQSIQPNSMDNMAPVPPVKKPKKRLLIGIISGSVLLLGLAAACLWYFLVYNNPTNVVLDAFSKVLAAKSGSTEGTISVKLPGSSVDVTLKSATNEARQQSVDAEVGVTVSGQTYKLSAQAAGSADESYVKLSGLRSAMDSMGTEYVAMIDAYYGSLLDKIDGKWVVIKATDLDTLNGSDESSKETKCLENETAKLSKDAALRNELVAIYKANPLFVVETRGSDANGTIYRLTPVSSSEAKKFFTAVAKTKFVAALDDCVSENLAESIAAIASGADTTSSDNVHIDLWIDGWSHTMNKVALNNKGSNAELSAEFTTKFNNNPTVTIPTADTTFNDLKAEIEKIEQQFMSAYSYPAGYEDDYSTSRLYY